MLSSVKVLSIDVFSGRPHRFVHGLDLIDDCYKRLGCSLGPDFFETKPIIDFPNFFETKPTIDFQCNEVECLACFLLTEYSLMHKESPLTMLCIETQNLKQPTLASCDNHPFLRGALCGKGAGLRCRTDGLQLRACAPTAAPLQPQQALPRTRERPRPLLRIGAGLFNGLACDFRVCIASKATLDHGARRKSFAGWSTGSAARVGSCTSPLEGRQQ